MSVETADILWRPMPIVDPEITPEKEQDLLVRLLSHDLPMFMIRSAIVCDPDEARNRHAANLERLEERLTGLFPGAIILRGISDEYQGFDHDGLGPFHNDAHESEPQYFRRRRYKNYQLKTECGLAIQTGLMGRAVVFAADMAPQPQGIIRPGATRGMRHTPYAVGSEDLEDPDNPNMLFRQGLVNPELTDPTVYVVETKPGDSVLFIEGGQHSTWHRFDSHAADKKRKIKITTLKASRQRGKKHYDPYSFDLPKVM